MPSSRAAPKQADIVGWLKQRMLSQQWLPGHRLPTRAALRERFRSGPDTIQAALDQLANEGFIEAHGRRGTFICEHPPHLCRYALVFPYPALQQHHMGVSMPSVLAHAAIAHRSPGRHFEFFSLENAHADVEDYRRLVADIRAQRLAGLIFATSPHMLHHTPVLEDEGIHGVSVASKSEHGMPDVYGDTPRFFERAVDYVKQNGRQRAAVLNTAQQPNALKTSNEESATSAIEQAGLTTHPFWFQAAHPMARQRIRQVVHLMMQPAQPDRPDAMIVGDDTLVEPATQGLNDAGMRVPADIEVVAQCNYPLQPPAATPVTWLGFSALSVLERCCQSLEAARRGETRQRLQLVPPLFEQEFEHESEQSNVTRHDVEAQLHTFLSVTNHTK